jgi:hypothetical protein
LAEPRQRNAAARSAGCDHTRQPICAPQLHSISDISSMTPLLLRSHVKRPFDRPFTSDAPQPTPATHIFQRTGTQTPTGHRVNTRSAPNTVPRHRARSTNSPPVGAGLSPDTREPKVDFPRDARAQPGHPASPRHERPFQPRATGSEPNDHYPRASLAFRATPKGARPRATADNPSNRHARTARRPARGAIRHPLSPGHSGLAGKETALPECPG